MFKEVFYKELLSTCDVGLVIDTQEWAIGINLTRGLCPIPKHPMAGSLLQISIFCLHLTISLP